MTSRSGAYIRPVAFRGYGEIGVAPKIEPPIDVAIAAWEWGKYLGDESEAARRRCLHLLLAARGAEHPAGAGQGRRQLPLQPADQPGGQAPGVRRRHRPVPRRHRQRGRRREPVPGQGRRAADPGAGALGARRHHARHRHAPGARARASRCARARCRASCCTSPTSCSSPARRSRSPRSARSIASPIGAGKRGPITETLQQAFFGLFTGATATSGAGSTTST